MLPAQVADAESLPSSVQTMSARKRASGAGQFEWFHLLREPVLLVAGDGSLLDANEAFLAMVGLKRVSGRNLAEFTFGPPEVALRYLEACSSGQSPVEGSLIFTDGEGGLCSCRSEAVAVERHEALAQRRLLVRLFPASQGSCEPSSRPRKDVQEELSDDAAERPERILQHALAGVELAVWEWDAKSDVLVATAGLEGMRGHEAKTFRGSLGDYLGGISSEDRQRVARTIDDALQSGTSYRVEYRVILRNLRVRWFEDLGGPIHDEQGQPTGIVCLTVPIDQRKQLEQQFQQRLERLTQTEAQVRSVIETAIDGIITINERGMILNINPAAERIFGYASEEIVGKNVSVLMPEPYCSQHNRYISNYLKTGQGKIIGTEREIVGRRKDGAVFPIDLGVSESRLEGRRYFTGIVRDITERKHAEHVAHFLADASRSLATLVDYASTLQQVAYLAVPFFADWCTVHIGHEDGSLRQLAAAHIDPEKAEVAQELGNGYPLQLDSPVGPARIYKTGKSDLRETVEDSLIESLAEDEQHRKVLRNLGLRSYMGVPLAARGRLFGVISFFSADGKRRYNLTDLALAEDLAHRASIAIENSLLYAELRESDRRKDEFLATLAQELRSPLAAVQQGLESRADEGRDPEAVHAARHHAQRLGRLADDLLDVSRVMQGRVELRREPIAVAEIVRRAVDQMRPAIAAAEQELTVEVPAEPILVYADPGRLAQVLVHLLANANKFTDPGGQIGVFVRRQRDQVFLIVEDDGVGISDESLPQVFELFPEASRSLHPDRRGLGIGLTLVRSLVELHDGSVTVSSEGEGKGSRFHVRLPIYKPAAAAAAPSSAPIAAGGRRILIVEDNVGTAKVLSRLLAKLGPHDVHIVHDGLSALEAAKEHRPELVLLDIGLPRLNGYEVAKSLRQRPEFQETVLVALTGYGTEEDRRRSAAAGFDRHLVKPPSLEHLRQVLAHPRLSQS